MTREQILEQVLTLGPDDRAYVADMLEQSLDAAPLPTSDTAVAWSREIDRRLAAYDNGDTAAVDFDIALEHMRQALAEHRAARKPA